MWEQHCAVGGSQCLGNEIERWMRGVGTVRALLVLPWDRNVLGMADDDEKTRRVGPMESAAL